MTALSDPVEVVRRLRDWEQVCLNDNRGIDAILLSKACELIEQPHEPSEQLPLLPPPTLVGWVDPADGALIATHGRETGGNAWPAQAPPSDWIPVYAQFPQTKGDGA
jgi:hypothetical protein